MTYDFFAGESDKKTILNYIFNETDLKIFDLASPPGEKVREYHNIADITSFLDLTDETYNTIHLQLWSPPFKGKPAFRRIELNPRHCNGHTFRYATEGWGLIQLYLYGIKGDSLKHSHIGHFNHKGAAKQEGTNPGISKAALWDWKEIQKTSVNLKYMLDKRLSVERTGTYRILPRAKQLMEKGIKLIY